MQSFFLRTKVLSLSFMTNACSFYVFRFFGAASSGFQYVRFALFPAHFALFFPLSLMLLFPTLFIALNALCISLFQSFLTICSRILSPFPSYVLLILQYKGRFLCTLRTLNFFKAIIKIGID